MRKELTQAKRIIIKVGTSTLIYPNGKVNLPQLIGLALFNKLMQKELVSRYMGVGVAKSI